MNRAARPTTRSRPPNSYTTTRDTTDVHPRAGNPAVSAIAWVTLERYAGDHGRVSVGNGGWIFRRTAPQASLQTSAPASIEAPQMLHRGRSWPLVAGPFGNARRSGAGGALASASGLGGVVLPARFRPRPGAPAARWRATRRSAWTRFLHAGEQKRSCGVFGENKPSHPRHGRCRRATAAGPSSAAGPATSCGVSSASGSAVAPFGEGATGACPASQAATAGRRRSSSASAWSIAARSSRSAASIFQRARPPRRA